MTKEELEKEAEEFTDTKKSFWRQGRTCIGSVKQAYIAGAEPREKRIEELIALINAERKRQEACDDVHLRKIADLEKENAELKTKVTALENANRAMVKELDDMTSGGVSVLKNIVRSKEQLTKAKEIIKNCLRLWNDVMTEENVKALIIEAEQFLNSEVEK